MQVLVRLSLPVPQVFEHDDQDPQSLKIWWKVNDYKIGTYVKPSKIFNLALTIPVEALPTVKP